MKPKYWIFLTLQLLYISGCRSDTSVSHPERHIGINDIETLLRMLHELRNYQIDNHFPYRDLIAEEVLSLLNILIKKRKIAFVPPSQQHSPLCPI